jgi:hypothetical protein
MIKVARGNLSTQNFEALLKGGGVASADFSAPAKGLFLDKVAYPDGVFLSESL